MRIALFLCIVACGARTGIDRGHGPDSSAPDSSRAPDAAVDVAVFDALDAPQDVGPFCERTRPVDIVLMQDMTGSTLDDPEIRPEVFQLIRDLLDPPDLDRDGRRDWTPVEDIHFALTSPPKSGFFNAAAAESFSGDLLGYWRAYGRGDMVEDEWRWWSPGWHDEVEEIEIPPTPATAFFSSTLRALLPPESPFPYRQSSVHVRRQGEFLRDESVLVVIVFTDDDDTSACTGEVGDECEIRCRFVRGFEECTNLLMSTDTALRGFRELAEDREFLMVGVAGFSSESIEVGCTLRGRELYASPRLATVVDELEGTKVSLCEPLNLSAAIGAQIAGRCLE